MIGVQAQTDVTSTYLTNADFEGDYSVYKYPREDGDNKRAIYQPNGWTVTYIKGEQNDMTTMNSSCLQWSNFSSQPQPTNGDNNSYWIRLPFGNGTVLTLSQTVDVPAGTYRLSADAFAQAATGVATISAAGKSVTVDTRNRWANYSLIFTLTETTSVTFAFSLNGVNSGNRVGFDNFKLEDITQGASDLSHDWTTTIANAGFELGSPSHSDNSVTTPYGYTMAQTMDGWKDGSINTTNPSEGSKLYNYWAGTTTSLDIYQRLQLPAGKYTISADLRTNGTDKITNQGVYAKIGSETFKSGTIQTVGNPWDGAEAWNSLSKDFYVLTDGTVQIGASSTGGASSVGWFQIDNFQLIYKGAVQNTPYSIAQGTATAATSGKWYAVTVPADGEYRFISSVDNTVYYTQKGYYAPSDAESQAVTAGVKQVVDLTEGTLYVQVANDATLTVEPDVYAYSVGDATVNVSSIQEGNSVTITWASASTNNPEASFAENGTPNITFNGNSVDIETTAKGFSFTVPGGLAANTEYTLAIPANAFGYAAGSTYNAAQNITLKTPMLLDGIYYFKVENETAAKGKYLSRGSTNGEHATVDAYGLPIQVTTNTSNETTLKAYDSGKYYVHSGSWDCNANGGTSTGGLYTITLSGGKYRIHNNSMDNDRFLKYNTGDVNNSVISVYDDGTGSNSGPIIDWSVETHSEHMTVLSTYSAKNYSNIITAAGLDGVTPETFLTYLSTNYAAKDKTSSVETAKFEGAAGSWTWTGVRNQKDQPAYVTNAAEAWQATGSWSQTITELPSGIYKVTVNAFERDGGYNLCNTLAGEGYQIVTSYFKANTEQVQLKSWYSDKEGTNNPNGTGEAATAFNNDKYKNEIYTYVSDEADGKGSLTLTLAKPGFISDNWVLFNNVTLTYYDASITDEEATAIINEAETEMEKPMKPSLYQALSTAKATFDGARNMANYNSLRTAIDNTATSIASYATMNSNYLSPIADLLSSSNIIDLTSSAYTEYVAYKNKYDNYKNSLTEDIDNAEANALTLYQSDDTRYTNKGNILMVTGWSINGNNALTDGSGFYANTWSGEHAGTAPAADFSRPFYEMWVSSGSISAATLTRTITGLTAHAIYKVTANVRVQYTSKVDNSITMKAGSGEAVDVTSGKKISSTDRYIDSYTAWGSADNEGNLIITFAVAENSGISWLAFRDINYEVAPASVSATIGTNGYTTFASPYPLDLTEVNLPKGVKAYKASIIDKTTLSFTKLNQVVPANTGILLKGTAGDVIIPVGINPETVEENVLTAGKGVLMTQDNDNYYFALKKNSNPMTFAKFLPESITIPTNKAYLKVDAGNFDSSEPEARLTIQIDGETAINAIEAAEANDGALKDGKYLIDGKIVIVKNGVKYDANGKKLN